MQEFINEKNGQSCMYYACVFRSLPGAATCSTNKNMPPGLNTLWTSVRAATVPQVSALDSISDTHEVYPIKSFPNNIMLNTLFTSEVANNERLHNKFDKRSQEKTSSGGRKYISPFRVEDTSKTEHNTRVPITASTLPLGKGSPSPTCVKLNPISEQRRRHTKKLPKQINNRFIQEGKH